MISGKEALIALANGESVEFKRHVSDSAWLKAKELKASEILNHCMILGGDSYSIEFRLKPLTITINSPKHVAQHLIGRKVEIVFKSHHDASVFFNEMQEVMFNDH